MKGLQGLIIAAALGIVGAAFNWFYLARLSKDYDLVSFIKIAPGAQINVGDPFKKEHLEELQIPKRNIGKLDKIAIPWDQLDWVITQRARKAYQEHELLFSQDLKTLSAKSISSLLSNNEVARSVAVDARTIVPERINPGDMVSFVVTLPRRNSNLLEQPLEEVTKTKTFGPFRILAVGYRTGTRQVQIASREDTGPQHMITIGVKYPIEPYVEEMFKLIQLGSGNRGVQMMVHASNYDDKKN